MITTRKKFHKLVLKVARSIYIDPSQDEYVIDCIDKLFIISEDGVVIPCNQHKPIFIYCLINPIDNNVFYVGRTCMPLAKRLMFHVADSNCPNKRKLAIIANIRKGKQNVIIKQLEEFKPIHKSEYNGTHKRELFWIKKYSDEGHDITNRRANIHGSIED